MNIKKTYLSLICVLLISLFLIPGISYGKNSVTAKNVILMIADGMGINHLRAAQLYSRKILNKELNMIEAMKTGSVAYLLNETADTTVTESAAAAGQIATGELMNMRVVSMKSDKITAVKSILEVALENNMATGLVTTSGITDATPAGFSAHVSNRYNETEIAEQQINKNINVLMGGRKKYYLPVEKGGVRKDGRDIISEAVKLGYLFVETAKGMEAAPDNVKILGLFNMENMKFEIERAGTTEPSLTEMTEKTLKILSKNKKGFLAMIEGGRIDHASHDNDTASMIHDVIAFDEAVGAVLNFAKTNGNTLVIITSDHETGGFAMIGRAKTGKEYVGMDIDAIEKIKNPLNYVTKKIKNNPDPENIIRLIKEHFFIEITIDEARIIAADELKKIDPYNYTYDYSHSVAFVLRPYHRISWGAQTHTAAPIPIIGVGPCAENIKGIMHNTEIFTIIKKSVGLK